MTRRTAAAASATLAALATLCACTSSDANPSSDDTTTTQSSGTSTTPPPDEPIDLGSIPGDTSLEPGTYSLPFLTGDPTIRAIVDVPEGLVGGGQVVISADGDGDSAFWGKVTQVDTDPCLGGKRISAGTTVHDLAAALVAQRHMKTPQPVPVTIGGYHGVYLKTTAPAAIDDCRGGSVTIFTAGSGYLQLDVPSATFRFWILNLNGQRVVGGTRSGPDPAGSAELAAMIESAEFTGVD